MVIRNMRGTTSAAAATIRAVGASQRQGSCDHADGPAVAASRSMSHQRRLQDPAARTDLHMHPRPCLRRQNPGRPPRGTMPGRPGHASRCDDGVSLFIKLKPCTHGGLLPPIPSCPLGIKLTLSASPDRVPLTKRSRSSPGHLARAMQIDAPMACQGRLGSGSARRLVICLARCSALVRDRPVVVMTLRLPRRSRVSQACPGGRPRELVEPVSIWTVTGGMAGRFRWVWD